MNMELSIIVPTYNEEKYIGQCLESIINEFKNTKLTYELIVVDNCSTDKTIEIARKFPAKILINRKRGNPSASRNLGALNAKYAVLCFVDGDCLITEEWSTQIFETFANEKVGAYGGPALSPANGNWIETAWAPTSIKPFLKSYATLPGANFSIRKSLFQQLGGFNEELITAEDDDLSKRTILSKMNVISDSKHAVIHLGYPKTLKEILKKQIWHGSSQLKAHGIFGDKMVMLTLVWLISIFGLPFSIHLHIAIFSINLSIIMLCPLLVAKKRMAIFQNSSAGLLLKSYIISWSFLAGRSIGLISETLKRAKK